MLGTTQKGLTLADKPVPKGGMSSSSLSRVPSAVGAFLAEFSSRRLVAGLALVVAMGSVEAVRAGPQPPPPARASVSVDPLGSSGVRVTFNPTGTSGAYDEYGVLYGGDFINLTALSRAQNAGVNLFSGSIVSITANVRLESFSKDITNGSQTFNLATNPDYATTANDLAIYIGVISPDPFGSSPPTPPLTFVNTEVDSLIFSGGLVQVGGSNGTGATPWPDWLPNSSSTPNSQLLNVTVPVGSPSITLGPSSIEEVWLANAYTSGPSFGRWSGTIDFTFAGAGGSGVPDASRTALLLAPGTLLLLGLAGRSRRRG